MDARDRHLTLVFGLAIVLALCFVVPGVFAERTQARGAASVQSALR